MPKQTDKELGLFFKNARHEQKLTYEELAEKAEMSSRYLKEIENGGRVPSFHKIRKLVRALNVPPEPLFYPNNHTDNLKAASFVFVSNSSLLLSILPAVLYILFLRSHSAIPQINSILLHKIHSSSFHLSLELFLITGSIIIFLFQKSNKLSKTSSLEV